LKAGLWGRKKDMVSIKKYQKELKRKEKASEKLARRQGKKDQDLKDFDKQVLPIEKVDAI
jgi:hypothetical protein